MIDIEARRAVCLGALAADRNVASESEDILKNNEDVYRKHNAAVNRRNHSCERREVAVIFYIE
jgi:hypothetical protein